MTSRQAETCFRAALQTDEPLGESAQAVTSGRSGAWLRSGAQTDERLREEAEKQAAGPGKVRQPLPPGRRRGVRKTGNWIVGCLVSVLTGACALSRKRRRIRHTHCLLALELVPEVTLRHMLPIPGGDYLRRLPGGALRLVWNSPQPRGEAPEMV